MWLVVVVTVYCFIEFSCHQLVQHSASFVANSLCLCCIHLQVMGLDDDDAVQQVQVQLSQPWPVTV